MSRKYPECRATDQAVDELEVARALRVAVASTVLSTSLVCREARNATVSIHLREVDGAVETARKLRHVDREGKLLVLEVEGLVLGVGGVHEVDTRADVRSGLKLKRERVARRGDAVCARVVGAVESTVSRAGRIVGTEGGVPGVALGFS